MEELKVTVPVEVLKVADNYLTNMARIIAKKKEIKTLKNKMLDLSSELYRYFEQYNRDTIESIHGNINLVNKEKKNGLNRSTIIDLIKNNLNKNKHIDEVIEELDLTKNKKISEVKCLRTVFPKVEKKKKIKTIKKDAS